MGAAVRAGDPVGVGSPRGAPGRDAQGAVRLLGRFRLAPECPCRRCAMDRRDRDNLTRFHRPPVLNHRLSPLDAGFLYAERPTRPLHIGFCLIYEGRLSRAAVLRAVRARLHLVPRLRQRVLFPPGAVAHPTWEDDPAFDLRHHVEELQLPPPADDRVLAEVGGQAFAPMLDRDRPLWQLILLHGRRDGSTAVIWKVHHALADGVAAVELLHLLHDLTPDAPPPAPPPWRPRPLPDPLTHWQDGLRDQWAAAARPWPATSVELLWPPATHGRSS